MKRKLALFLLFSLVFLGGFAQHKYSEALLKKAQQGNVEAQLELGRSHMEDPESGGGSKEALIWFEKAAAKNNLEAMLECARMYCDQENFDLEPDFIKGVAWYKKAAAKGNAEAKEFLKALTQRHDEEEIECPFLWLPCDDDLENYSYLKDNENIINKEHQNGNPIATYYLAVMAYVEKDFAKTIKLLEDIYPLVTNEDNEFHDFLLTDEYEKERLENSIGTKVPSLLGWCYEYGQGADPNYEKAANYYLTDFDYTAFGIPMIPRVRGAYCYLKGGMTDKFIEQAEKQGVSLYDRTHGVMLKVPCLQFELARMYKTGNGVSENKAKALEIYETIVDNRESLQEFIWNLPEIRSYSDLARAAYNASKMYEKGEGCSKDETMKELYFDLALKFGDPNAWYEYNNR